MVPIQVWISLAGLGVTLGLGLFAMGRLYQRVQGHDDKFDGCRRRLEQLEDQWGATSGRLESRINKIDTKLDDIAVNVASLCRPK